MHAAAPATVLAGCLTLHIGTIMLGCRLDVAEIVNPELPLDTAITKAGAAAATAGGSSKRSTDKECNVKAQPADAKTSSSRKLATAKNSPAAASTNDVPSEHYIKAGRVGSEINGVITAQAAADLSAAATDPPADATATQALAGYSGPEIPEDFICPITNDIMKDPVRACDGKAYERDAITTWFDLGNSRFPGGHDVIRSMKLDADVALRACITGWQQATNQG